ncbi:unnamed protein product [Sphagnum jensenii]|uniref:Uncharacterized protein n=1 Tax=Sphagnum jensenii TaxID=128206 RepID=A0ABP0X8Y6_9BRYO
MNQSGVVLFKIRARPKSPSTYFTSVSLSRLHQLPTAGKRRRLVANLRCDHRGQSNGRGRAAEEDADAALAPNFV